jgi:hypothetical protein
MVTEEEDGAVRSICGKKTATGVNIRLNQWTGLHPWNRYRRCFECVRQIAYNAEVRVK